MNAWSIYRLDTGELTGGQITASEYNARLQLRDGEALVAGHWDRAVWRVEGGAVVPYLPPRPADDEWQTWALSDDGARWVSTPTAAALWRDVRAARDALLAACDWTQLPDVPAATREAWRAYRQALRDVTSQPDPAAVAWPVKPE